MTTSIVIPVFNERDNLTALHQQLKAVMEDSFIKVTYAPIYGPFEFIFVDDGSTDHSMVAIRQLARKDRRVRYVQLQRNFGKTAALDAGFRAATGQIIITMDADLQDDPAELPKLLRAMFDNGYDMVGGWRVNRTANDPLSKTMPSRLYNAVVRKMTGVNLHDMNCGYKVYRREALAGLHLYGELHRFIPVLLAWRGYAVGETPVNHRPRYAGNSKFGSRRLLRGFLDFLMVLFITRYLHHPLRLFGPVGVVTFGLGLLVNLYLAGLWFGRLFGLADVPPIGTRPALAVGVLAMLFGGQLFSIGLIGEMIRHFSFKPEQEYIIKEVKGHQNGKGKDDGDDESDDD